MGKLFSFSRRRKYQTAVKRALIIGVFLLSVLVVFFSYPSEVAFRGIKEQSQYALNAVVNVIRYPVDKVNDFFVWVGDVSSVRNENKELHQMVRSLQKEIKDQQNIIQENRALKRQINLTRDYPYQYISARIFSDNTTTYFKTLLVDAGLREGVKRYQAVLSNGYLIGQVIEVFDHSSRVLLLTDSNVKIPVMNTRTRIRSFLKGNNVDGAVLYNLEKKEPVIIGDQIVTSGFDGIFPSDIPVGVIKKVSKGGRILVELFEKKEWSEDLSRRA